MTEDSSHASPSPMPNFTDGFHDVLSHPGDPLFVGTGAEPPIADRQMSVVEIRPKPLPLLLILRENERVVLRVLHLRPLPKVLPIMVTLLQSISTIAYVPLLLTPRLVFLRVPRILSCHLCPNCLT